MIAKSNIDYQGDGTSDNGADLTNILLSQITKRAFVILGTTMLMCVVCMHAMRIIIIRTEKYCDLRNNCWFRNHSLYKLSGASPLKTPALYA
jgi:hypothetical protein